MVANTPLSVERRLNLTWRMLATLGAPAQAPPLTSTAVDPECTLLLAALGGIHDARLLEVGVWFAASARRSLSLARVRTLATAFGADGEQALQQFVRAAALVPELRPWIRSLPGGAAAPLGTAGIDLTRLRERLGAHDLADAVVRQPGALRMRTRLAFGVGARAEAFAALLVRSRGRAQLDEWIVDTQWTTLTELESMTDFGRRHLLDHLPDMARVGLLRQRRAGRAHEFLAAPTVLPELGPIPPRWVSWTPHMVAVFRLEAAISEVDAQRSLSSVMDAQRTLKPVERELGLAFAETRGVEIEHLVPQFLDWAQETHQHLTDDIA